MPLLISDTNILIDMQTGSLLKTMFPLEAHTHLPRYFCPCENGMRMSGTKRLMT
ncbi:MAG: PIN domain-containing protein [Gammaproteobacteria bacterium]|nr:PIN domain-containing protein [Gammaproteobacteria bacterium]